ncbi:MAG TPA: hypothetical protein VKC60_03555 [Opitutaceae bacterium]|nr:hypothetical protein [Opitutaceae bacterium]
MHARLAFIFRTALLFSLVTGVTFAAQIAMGDSYEKVVGALGRPQGEVHIGQDTILDYERGRVELHEGKVVSSDLLSEAEATKRDELQRAAAQKEQERRASHLSEGKVLKAETSSDPDFAARPASQQLAFWQDFRARYPEIPSDDVYVAALNRNNRERAAYEAEIARSRQVAELQSRVDEAEARAAHAEWAAKNALARSDQIVSSPPEPQVVYVPGGYPYYLGMGGYSNGHFPRNRQTRPIINSAAFGPTVITPLPATITPLPATYIAPPLPKRNG